MADTDEDTRITIDVLANDFGRRWRCVAVTIHSGPSHGSVAANPDGTISYTPNADFHGDDSFQYLIDDGHGGVATGTVTVSVKPVNDAPIAADDRLPPRPRRR